MVKEKNFETSDKFCKAEIIKNREQNYFSVALLVKKLQNQKSKLFKRL